MPVLIAEKRRADYPDTPTVLEFVKDAHTRQQLELVMITQNLDRPVLAPPGTPAERVKELRDGLMATLADRAFLAEIEKKNLFVDPVPGEEHGEGVRQGVRVLRRRSSPPCARPWASGRA